MSKNYRIGVLGVFVNNQGQVLVGKRSKTQDQWQFPQGGIEEGETPEEAIFREMEEEVGTRNFVILQKSSELVHYDFPPDLNAKIALEFKGQQHYWFLLKFNDELKDGPNLAKTNGEFQEFKWVNVQEIVNNVIYWKRKAYIKGLQLLGFRGI